MRVDALTLLEHSGVDRSTGVGAPRRGGSGVEGMLGGQADGFTDHLPKGLHDLLVRREAEALAAAEALEAAQANHEAAQAALVALRNKCDGVMRLIQAIQDTDV